MATTIVNGVSIEKVDVAHMLGIMKALGLGTDGDEVDALVVRLSMHFREHTKQEATVSCDACGGLSDEKLDACPFCGVGGTEGEAGAQVSAEEEPTPFDAPAGAADDAPAEERQMVQVKGKAAKKPAAAKSPKANVEANGRALAKVEPAPVATRSPAESELDAQVAEVHRMKVSSATSMWELGGKIAAIYKSGLWKVRTGEDGKARWKSWDAFCNFELGMTPPNAGALMDIHANVTPAVLEACGKSKLTLMFQAPKEDQPAIQKMIEGGASANEVRREVRRLKKDKGYRRPDRGGTRAGKVSQQRPNGARAAEQITVAKLLGRTVVTLCQSGDKKKAAFKVGQTPTGQIELANGVVMHFTISGGGDKPLKLIVNTKRAEG